MSSTFLSAASSAPDVPSEACIKAQVEVHKCEGKKNEEKHKDPALQREFDDAYNALWDCLYGDGDDCYEKNIFPFWKKICPDEFNKFEDECNTDFVLNLVEDLESPNSTYGLRGSATEEE